MHVSRSQIVFSVRNVSGGEANRILFPVPRRNGSIALSRRGVYNCVVFLSNNIKHARGNGWIQGNIVKISYKF